MSATVIEQDRPARDIDLSALRERQHALRRQGRLHWFHWLIVAASVGITLLAWHASRSIHEQRARIGFERESERVIAQMQERLSHYEDALLSSVAAIRTDGGRTTRARWRRYTDFLALPERYPGIRGIGVIEYVAAAELGRFVAARQAERPGFEVHPDHDFDFHLPIVHVEPLEQNAAAVGLDVAFETHRRTAALRARRLGTTQISGPIVLVQDESRTPGFLFYAPYYDAAQADRIDDRDRKARFRGMVYAPLVVSDLVAETLGRENRQVSLTIRDDGETIYAEDGAPLDGSSPLSFSRDVALYGRTWHFEVRGTGTVVGIGAIQPHLVLFGGLTIDALLLLLFLLMARSNRRTLNLAEEMTDDLAGQARSIAASNRDLERFAHVVSHDLKTPIRGVRDVTAFLEEDLADYLASDGADPNVRTSLDHLHRQALKGDALIDGILDYSLVGAGNEALSRVDVRELIEDIARSPGLPPGRVELAGEFPVLDTHAVRLGQVFANLIGNAFKYHHDPERATVRVRAERRGAFHRFEVSDDGPGIEPRFHERIFETFTTLGSDANVAGSGIGLSIVKKSVELLGGTVAVDSALGRGTTFRFDWPAEGDVEADTEAA